MDTTRRLGNRLGNIANKHRALQNWRSTLKNKLAREAKPSQPVYNMGNWSSDPKKPKKNCGPKPMAWLNAKTKNPEYAAWLNCSGSSAAGGKRKTRRRATRRRR